MAPGDPVRLGAHGDEWIFERLRGLREPGTGLAVLGEPPDPPVMFEEHRDNVVCRYLVPWPDGELNPAAGPQAELPEQLRIEMAEKVNDPNPRVQIHAINSAFGLEDADVVNEMLAALRRSLGEGGGEVWIVQATNRLERRRALIRILNGAQAQPTIPLDAFIGARQPMEDHSAGHDAYVEHLVRPIVLLASPFANGFVASRVVRAAAETYVLVGSYGPGHGVLLTDEDATWTNVFDTSSLFRDSGAAGLTWLRELNVPAGDLTLRALLPWWTDCVNRLYTVMTDLGRFADADGLFDGRRAYRAFRTLDRLFVNCARIQVHADDHVGRVSSSFEILDLLDNLVDRQLGAREIYATLFDPERAAAIFRGAFADAPNPVRQYLEQRTEAILRKLREETLDHVLSERLEENSVRIGAADPQPMEVGEYLGRLFQAMRDTHHGYHLDASWKRDVLDTSTGHISVAFPELIVMLVFALVGAPEAAINGSWFDFA